jgi:hypothetical protein
MAEFAPKPLSYEERLAKAQRTVKAAQHRSDPKLAIRELCEAIGELITAFQEREQALKSPPAPAPADPASPPGN